MSGKRVVLAAGGTGGHFYPGLVLAQTLAARGWTPLMLVRRGDPALAALEREGIASCEVPLRGMPRAVSPALLGFGRDLLRSTLLVGRVIRDFAPNVVLGMGGYLTFPAVASAARRGLPRAVHESNAVPGLANRAAAALGASFFWGLPPVSGGGKVTGTPIRRALWTRADKAASRRELGLDPARPTILVFGGSQGARGLNLGAPRLLPKEAQILHLAGRTAAPEVEAAYRAAGKDAKVLPFLERMELAYGAADLAVCRSGASTLAELAAQGLPAVLVPFPAAAANHQEINARALERAGACRVALERELDARLPDAARDLLSCDRRAVERAYASLGLPAPEACAAGLADAVEALR